MQQDKGREPALSELADDDDELSWDRDRDGLMADAATTPDDEPETEAWVGGEV